MTSVPGSSPDKLKNLGTLLNSVAGNLAATRKDLDHALTRIEASERSLEVIQKEIMKVVASLRKEEENKQ